MRKQIDLIKLVISLALFCFVSNQILFSQEQVTKYKVEVKEKLLYVLALDKDGNPVTDLKKEDFQLFVDGQSHEIETFSLIFHSEEEPIAEEKEIATKKLEIVDRTIKELESKKRFILAVLPYKYTSFRHRWKIKKSVTHLVKQAQYPDTWIGIVSLHRDWIATIQDFTYSKEKISKKIEAYFNFDIQKLKHLHNEYPLSANEISQVPQLPIFEGTLRVIGGIDIIPGLETIAKKMSVLKGRKIIICYSLPLDIFHDSTGGLTSKYGMNRLDAFFKMINKVVSNNITIYYTEAKGPHIPNFFDASSGVDLSSHLLPGSSAAARHVKSYVEFCQESSHFALAKETGGKYYYNISSPTYFIDDLYKINSSYYLISFPITIQLNKNQSLSIKLKCKREGVKLYYSNKYYAPHELDEKEFRESYKQIQLYKCLLLDTAETPKLKISGNWIPIPADDATLQMGFIDFYLPEELFQKLPVSYQLGCSYKNKQGQGIVFQWKLVLPSSEEKRIKTSHGYKAIVLIKIPRGKKLLKLVAMNNETGKYGKAILDIAGDSKEKFFSPIIMGELSSKDTVYEYRDYSEALYDIEKDFYKLLSIKDRIIIPSLNRTYKIGDKISFCLIHKLPEKQLKQYENHKIYVYILPDKKDQITEIKLPIHIKKVKRHYLQYYGTIDTENLQQGNYRVEICITDADNTIIKIADAYFKIIP
jgi:VWFA-related protein